MEKEIKVVLDDGEEGRWMVNVMEVLVKVDNMLKEVGIYNGWEIVKMLDRKGKINIKIKKFV